MYLSTLNMVFITSKVNRTGFCFPFTPFSNSKSDNVLLTCPNKFSIGKNSGVLVGVKSKLTLSCSLTRSMIRDDLWALKTSSKIKGNYQRLSSIKTSFYWVYFASIAIIRA